MKVRLADMKVFIEAPRELVFQMLSATGKGRFPVGMVSRPEYWSEKVTPLSPNFTAVRVSDSTVLWKE